MAPASGRSSPVTTQLDRACVTPMRAERYGSATGSSPRARAASSRPGFRWVSSPALTPKVLGSSPTRLYRESITSGSLTMVSPKPCPIRCPSLRVAVSARNPGSAARRRCDAERGARHSLAWALGHKHDQRAADRNNDAGGALVDRAAAPRRLRGADTRLHVDGHLLLDDLPAGSVVGSLAVPDRHDPRPAFGADCRGRPRSRCCLPERSYYPSGIILLTGPSRSSGPASPC